MNPSSHYKPEGNPCVGCHVSRVTDRESKRKQKRTLTNTGSCIYTRRAHTCFHRRATHSQTHLHEHRYASSHAHRLAAPLHRLVFVARTIAGGKGKRRQLHSARRQTTFLSDVGYRILVIVVAGNAYVSRPIPTQVVRPTTCLQGTGPAASAPQTRTHARSLTA
jgi:hypothetical protein